MIMGKVASLGASESSSSAYSVIILSCGERFFRSTGALLVVAGTMQGWWLFKDLRSEAGHALPMLWMCEEDQGRGEGDEPFTRYVR